MVEWSRDFVRCCREMPSQEFRNSVKEKGTGDISDEILVCGVVAEPLIIWVGKIVDLERFVSMDRLLWVASYVLRFAHNIKSRVKKNLKLRTGNLYLEKFDNSEALWLKYEQGLVMFDSECNYKKLKHSLNLYEDENNILCLKSRFDSLVTSNHDQKNPILLGSHSLFTDLLILKYHEKCSHSGVNASLNLLRTKFWIIRGRQTVKKYLKNV